MGEIEIGTDSNQFNIPSIYLTFPPYRSLSIYNGDTLPPTAQSIWSLVNRFCHIWFIEWLSYKAQLVHCNIHKCTCTSKWRKRKILFKIWFVNETVMGSESINKERKKNLWLHQNGKKKIIEINKTDHGSLLRLTISLLCTQNRCHMSLAIKLYLSKSDDKSLR